MRVLHILFSCLLCCACEKPVSYYPSEKEYLSNMITKNVATQLKNELGLTPFGSGGQARKQIKMLALAFLCHKPIDIETGRELLIAAVNKFAAEINANEAIRPYLNNYPFGPKNIEIEIYIRKPNGKEVESDELCIISASNGVLKYKIYSGKYNLKTVYEETFEEALQKLNRAKQSA
jgi:hypothetical protein